MLDLKKPIEAVHIKTGRVVPVTFSHFSLNGFETKECPDSSTTNRQWYRDGRDYCHQNEWFVRNKELTVTTDTDTDTNTSPPDWAMKEARRRIAASYNASVDASGKTNPSGNAYNASIVKPLAEMIAKHEEPPVDPDELVVVELLNVYLSVSRDLSHYGKYTFSKSAFAKTVKKYKELKEKSSV